MSLQKVCVIAQQKCVELQRFIAICGRVERMCPVHNNSALDEILRHELGHHIMGLIERTMLDNFCGDVSIIHLLDRWIRQVTKGLWLDVDCQVPYPCESTWKTPEQRERGKFCQIEAHHILYAVFASTQLTPALSVAIQALTAAAVELAAYYARERQPFVDRRRIDRKLSKIEPLVSAVKDGIWLANVDMHHDALFSPPTHTFELVPPCSAKASLTKHELDLRKSIKEDFVCQHRTQFDSDTRHARIRTATREVEQIIKRSRK